MSLKFLLDYISWYICNPPFFDRSNKVVTILTIFENILNIFFMVVSVPTTLLSVYTRIKH